MAAGTYTLISLLKEMKLRLEGSGLNVGRLSDDQYEGFIYQNITSTESTYTFQKTTTVWRYMSGTIALELASSGAWSSIPDDTTWTLYANGTIKQETGTAHTGDTITITGTPVNFGWAMADALDMLATLHASDMSLSGSSSSDVASVKQALQHEAGQYRGGYGV